MAEAPATEEDGSIHNEENEDGSIQREEYKRGSIQREEPEDGSIQLEEYKRGSIQHEEYKRSSIQHEEYKDGNIEQEECKHGSIQCDESEDGSIQHEEPEVGSMQHRESVEASRMAESRRGSMPTVTARGSLPTPDVDLVVLPPSLESLPGDFKEGAEAAIIDLLKESEEASRMAESRRGSMPTVTLTHRNSLTIPDIDLVVLPPSLESMPNASKEGATVGPVDLLQESKEASRMAESRRGSMPAVTARGSLPTPEVDLEVPPPSLENMPDACEEGAAATSVDLLEESQSMPEPVASEEGATATPVDLLQESEEANIMGKPRKDSMPAILMPLTERDSLPIPDIDLVVPPPSLENMPDASEEGAAAAAVHLLKESDFTLEKVLSETKGGLLPSPELIVTSSNDQDEEEEDDDDDDLCLDGESGLTKAHVMTCRICQLFVRTVDRLLDKSEELMDQYLPLTEAEIGNLQEAIQELDTPNADSQMQACLARITDLSSQLRQRAYMLALSKLRLARQNTQESFCQLHQTITLIETVQQGEASQVRASHMKLNEMCKSWAEKQGMRVSAIDVSNTNEQEEEEEEEEDENEEVIAASKAREDSVAFPGEDRGREDSMAFPGEDRGREDSMAFPGEDRGREDSMAFPGEDRGREDSMAFPGENIEEPDKNGRLTAPIVRLHEDRSRMESRILRTDDRFKEEAEQVSERSRRKSSRRIQIDALTKDEADITITVPGCEKEDGLPLPRPHRTKSRRLTYSESTTQETESSALEMSRGLVSHLQDTYQGLLVNLQDVPANLKNKLQNTCQHMAELQASFARAANFGELGSSVLNNSLNVMAEAEDNMDNLLDFAFQNPIGLIAKSAENESNEATQPDKPEGTGQPSSEEKVKEEEKEDRHDILKLQKAYDPKGCEGED